MDPALIRDQWFEISRQFDEIHDALFKPRDFVRFVFVQMVATPLTWWNIQMEHPQSMEETVKFFVDAREYDRATLDRTLEAMDTGVAGCLLPKVDP
jgi:hypothetical protein